MRRSPRPEAHETNQDANRCARSSLRRRRWGAVTAQSSGTPTAAPLSDRTRRGAASERRPRSRRGPSTRLRHPRGPTRARGRRPPLAGVARSGWHRARHQGRSRHRQPGPCEARAAITEHPCSPVTARGRPSPRARTARCTRRRTERCSGGGRATYGRPPRGAPRRDAGQVARTARTHARFRVPQRTGRPSRYGSMALPAGSRVSAHRARRRRTRPGPLPPRRGRRQALVPPPP